jgi:hypothetical protein
MHPSMTLDNRAAYDRCALGCAPAPARTVAKLEGNDAMFEYALTVDRRDRPIRPEAAA